MSYKPELFKSMSLRPSIPIVSWNPNLMIPMPCLLPFLFFWSKYFKQVIEEWKFRAMVPIEPSQLYTPENFTSTSSNANIFDGNRILNCDCFYDFCFFAINIANGFLRKELFNSRHTQNHHNCLTLNPCNVLLQIQIHSL